MTNPNTPASKVFKTANCCDCGELMKTSPLDSIYAIYQCDECFNEILKVEADMQRTLGNLEGFFDDLPPSG